MPVPWRSGTIADVALGHAGQQPVELARVEQRAVAGEQDDAVGAVGFGAGDPGQRRLDVAVVLGVGHDLGAERSAASSCAIGSPLTTIVRSIVRAAPIASSTSATIAAASASPPLVVEPRRRAAAWRRRSA